MGLWVKTVAIVFIATLGACEQGAGPVGGGAVPDETVSQPTGGEQIVGIATVTDGDTIEIHGQAIRIHGVDAPERGKSCGDANVYQQASLALSDFIGARTVSCTINGRDRDRQVATCTAGGVDLAEHTTEQGWTRDWPRYSGGAYADEEAEARAASRGIWGLACPDDLWGARDYAPRTP